MKQCSKCGVLKSEADFSKDRTRQDGLHRQCKVCRVATRRAYEKTEEFKAQRRAYRARIAPVKPPKVVVQKVIKVAPAIKRSAALASPPAPVEFKEQVITFAENYKYTVLKSTYTVYKPESTWARNYVPRPARWDLGGILK